MGGTTRSGSGSPPMWAGWARRKDLEVTDGRRSRRRGRQLAHATTMRRAAGGRVAQLGPGTDAYRTALVNRLRAACSQPVVAIVAPAGYGKTTLLSQWREREHRPFLDEPGGEPCVVLVDDAHLADPDRVAALIASASDGSTVVLAGRSLP